MGRLRVTVTLLASAGLLVFSPTAGAEVAIDWRIDTSAVRANAAGDADAFGRIRARIDASLSTPLGPAWRSRYDGAITVNHSTRGCPAALCAPNSRPVEWFLSHSWSHYALGRFSIGRLPSLAGRVATEGHPFGADTIASDRCAALLVQRCGSAKLLSLAAESPTFYDRITLHAQAAFDAPGWDFTLRADIAVGPGWLIVAANNNDRGDWRLPIGYSAHLAGWRLFGLAVAGDRPAGQARPGYRMLGATTPWLGGEFRLAAADYRTAATTKDTSDAELRRRKVSVGFHRPVSLRMVPYVDLVDLHAPGERRSLAIDVGVRVSLR